MLLECPWEYMEAPKSQLSLGGCRGVLVREVHLWGCKEAPLCDVPLDECQGGLAWEVPLGGHTGAAE